MKLIAIGSIALDSVETPDERVENVWGGSAVYFSVSASFFSEVGIVGVAGKDFPAECINELEKRGISLDGLQIKEGKTFRWEGKYFENMNERETLKVCLNVFEDYNPLVPDSYRNAEYVFLGNISPKQQMKVLENTSNPALVAADTMDLWINNEKEDLLALLKQVDMLILNDSEARLLTGEKNLLRASEKITEMGPGIIVVKRGENGAILMRDGELLLSMPAYPLSSFKDPTGAGDAFGGGMIGYIAREGKTDNHTLKRAVGYGSVTASFCVEEFSLGKLKTITLEDIEERLEAFSKITSF